MAVTTVLRQPTVIPTTGGILAKVAIWCTVSPYIGPTRLRPASVAQILVQERALDGMAENDEEDFFSDDDLDTLPVQALEELEQKAVFSTQHHVDYNRQPSSDYGNFDDEALEAALIDAEEPPAIPNAAEQYLENKVAEGVTQREQWRRDRYGVGQTYRGDAEQQQRAQGLQGHFQRAPQEAKDNGYLDLDMTIESRKLPLQGMGVVQSITGQGEEVNELQAKIAEVGFHLAFQHLGGVEPHS